MYSLRTKILAIGLLFLVFIIAAFAFYNMTAQASHRQLRLEEVQRSIEQEAQRGNLIIAGIERGAMSLALDGQLYNMTKSYDVAYTSVHGYVQSYPTAVGGGFWFEPYAYDAYTERAGIYVYYDKTIDDSRVDDSYFSKEYDYHHQYWYQELAGAIERPYQVAWTKPYYDDSGLFSLMTTAGAGIFDADGKLIGISTVDWELEKIIEELSKITFTANSFVFLSVPDKDYIITNTYDSAYSGQSINSLPFDIYADFFILNGVKYQSFCQVMNNGWHLHIQIPVKELYAETEKHTYQFIIIISISSVVTLCLTFVLISKLINAPIKRLTSDVERLADGNLNVHIDIDTKDEIGMLARTFNKMSGDLKESIEVNEREGIEKERIITELNVAKTIQESMLPCVFPPFPDRPEFDLYASMLPARQVGGDFYDFYMVDESNLALVVADVSGKGVPAALFMVIAKTLIKNNAMAGKSPGEVFRVVNNILCENNDACMFVTAFMGIYNIESGRLTYVNAGHNPPLLKRASGGYEFMKTKQCKFLAFMEDMQYNEESITLNAGDVLFMYTDGVTETMDAEHTMFSDDNLLIVANAYKGSQPEELLDAVMQGLEAFAAGAEQNDDITMLALHVNGAQRAAAMAGAAGGDAEAGGDIEAKELIVGAYLERLDDVINFVNDELETYGYPPDVKSEIVVSVEEVFTNITNYAYDEKPQGDVMIKVSATDGEASIKFSDEGQPYNPLEHIDPDLEKPLMEREIGGLGIFLVKRLMDNVEYERIDEKNVLVISKKY